MAVQNVKCPCGNSFQVETGGLDSFQCTCPACQTDLEINSQPQPKQSSSPKRGTFTPTSRANQKPSPTVPNNPVVECTCGFKFKVATRETDYQCQCPKCQAMIQVGQPKPKPPAQATSPIRNAVADPLNARNLSQHVPQANPTYQPLQPKKIKKKKKPRPSAKKENRQGCLWFFRLIITIKLAKLVVVGLILIGFAAFAMMTASYGARATVKGVVPFDRESIEKNRETGGVMIFDAESIGIAVYPRNLNEEAYVAFRDSQAKGTVIEFGFDELMTGSNVYKVNSMKVGGKWLMKPNSKGKVDFWTSLQALACCSSPFVLLGYLVVMSAIRLHREAKGRR